MFKTLKRFVLASEDFIEFYDLAMRFLKSQKKTIDDIKKELGATDLETFYLYHKRLENLEKAV